VSRKALFTTLGVLAALIVVIVVVVGSADSTAKSSPACSIASSHISVQVHLSAGPVSCGQTSARVSYPYDYFAPGVLSGQAGSGVPRGTTPTVDCTLTQHGQTATVSYGAVSGGGGQSDADHVCSSLRRSGWTQIR